MQGPDFHTRCDNAIALLRSPLLRHPRLALRKAVRKARGTTAPRPFDSPPAGASYACPPELAKQLRRWIEHVAPTGPRYSYGRVFGRDIAPDALLERCRKAAPAGGTGIESDIKLVWEFSRGHDLFLDAALASTSTRDAVASDLAGRVRAWIDANNDPAGVNWSCAMEVAIRAVNWICADALLNGALRERVGPALWDHGLWNHGRVIWNGREIRLINSNHYIANLLGLQYLGSVFHTCAEADRWRRLARQDMPRALAAQTHSDGGLYEASLPYHALVTEMTLLHLLLDPSPAVRRIAKPMCRVVVDLLDARGDMVRFGDDDSGRILPLDFLAPERGRGRVLLELERVVTGNATAEPSASALYPQSGWWMARGTHFAAAMEFGGVGMAGLGAHAHNDSLSVCLWWNDRPVFVDPGSYLYTGDPAARNVYRSAAAHNTLRVNGQEHIALPVGRDRLFELRGSTRPARVASHGQDHLEVTCSLNGQSVRRRVDIADGATTVSDRVDGRGQIGITWSFHCAPDLQITSEGGTALISWPDGAVLRFTCSNANAQLGIRDGAYSACYGTQVPSRILEWSLSTSLPCEVSFTLSGAT